MKGHWVKVGPNEQPYCEVVADDSGMVYIAVQSGSVRTSDYLIPEDAYKVAHAILDAVHAATGTEDAQARELAALREERAHLRRVAPLLAALDEWGRARREEAVAIQTSFDASHRGPAWFARCVAGEQRVAAEGALFAEWEKYVAGGARGRQQEGDKS